MSSIDKELYSINSKIRYRFPLREGSRVMILAAHSDDETIGCAGTIAYLRKYSIDITITLFTKPIDVIEANVRLEEFKSAIEHLGCRNSFILGFPDGHLRDFFAEAKMKLKKIISESQPDIIFAPYLFDSHQDHRCVCEILARVTKESSILIAMYEIWVPILHPNFYINISEEWENKVAALKYYHSQEEKYSIIKKVEILNRLRAELSMRRHVQYVEAFKCFQGKDFWEAISMLKSNTER